MQKLNFPLEKSPSEVSWEERGGGEQGWQGGCSSGASCLMKSYSYSPSEQIPSMGDVLTQHIYTSFLIRMRKKKEKPRWRVQVVSGEAQCLFRKSCGFCVFHMSFSEPQNPCQMGSWGKWGWNETQRSWEPLDSAEARRGQACPLIAPRQAGKEDFLGSSVLWLERPGVRR